MIHSIRMLTINYTQKWNGGINGNYVTLTSGSTDYQDRFMEPSTRFYQRISRLPWERRAYVQTENVTYWDGTSETGTWTITVPADLSTYAYTTEYVVYDATGTANLWQQQDQLRLHRERDLPRQCDKPRQRQRADRYLGLPEICQHAIHMVVGQHFHRRHPYDIQ